MIVKMKAGAFIYSRLMHLFPYAVCVSVFEPPNVRIIWKNILACIAIRFIIIVVGGPVVGASSRSLFDGYACACARPAIEFVCSQFNKLK